MKIVKTLAIAAIFAGSASLALAQGPGINSSGANLSSPPPGGTEGRPATGQNAPVKKHMSKKKTQQHMPQ